MTNTMQLLKSEKFGEVQADIYSDNNEMFMTAKQLAECLGYADKSGLDKIISRNPYVKESEFSGTVILSVPQGSGYSKQETRVFNEQGIYEVAFLSKTAIARKFRSWVRGILTALRKGELQLSSSNVSLSPQVIDEKIQQLIGANEELQKTIKDQALSISFIKSEIFKMVYAPSNSEWKRKVNAKILEISKENGKSCANILNSIVYQMKENGYDLVKLMHQYEFENGLQTPCPSMEYIDKHEDVKRQFEIILDKIETFYGIRKQIKPNEDEVPIIKPTEQTTTRLIRSTIKPLIEKYNDRSVGGNCTYRKVYTAMGVGWLNRQTRYKNEHKLKNKPKKTTLIEQDKKLLKLFIDTVRAMLQD